ncbi:MAG: hypothetical protein FJ387_12445, partial [Verrucomicrobia bacterium]|nr:hypothetical protein [Verrucomicrobiota bacterium]
AREGVQRVFVLDACRNDLEPGREAAGAGLQGEQLLRDVVCAPTPKASASLALICSCGEGRKALEAPQLGQGLFSRALLDELEAALDTEAELTCGEVLQQHLRERMGRLAAQCGLAADQRPWVQLSDQAPVLIPGRWATTPRPVTPPPVPPASNRVLCPVCGLRNDPDGTFRCRLCGRDYLCRDHFVRGERCCEECAARLAEERQRDKEAAERRAAEERQREAERQRIEAERVAAERKRQMAQQERQRQEAAARKQAEEEARRKNPRNATKEPPWENSLGMRFVPVPGTEVLFSVWQTRVRDYAAFVKATGREWEKPGFEQGAEHPAVNVSWEDGMEFCEWLTKKERGAGLLMTGQEYRLPADAEWSWAVGIGDREGGGTPAEKSMKLGGVYPWGTQWPPPKGAGNYDPGLKVDDFEYTSPVGSFKPSEHGLYDLGGNVWEWCEDCYDGRSGARVLRGGSWNNNDRDNLLSSSRRNGSPDRRFGSYGFRVVLAGVFAAG